MHFFYLYIHAFVKFLYELLKPFDNLIVTMKKVISWFLQPWTEGDGSEALDSLDAVKCFADIHGDMQMNVILNELIGKVEKLKLQNARQSTIKLLFLEFKLSAITINVKYGEVFVYDDFFFEKVQNFVQWIPPYSGHFFSGIACVCYRKVFDCISFSQTACEMTLNKKEKVQEKNIKELRGSRSHLLD